MHLMHGSAGRLEWARGSNLDGAGGAGLRFRASSVIHGESPFVCTSLRAAYENGFFWFTLGLPHDYGEVPPKVKLQTTGGGSVRFNP